MKLWSNSLTLKPSIETLFSRVCIRPSKQPIATYLAGSGGTGFGSSVGETMAEGFCDIYFTCLFRIWWNYRNKPGVVHSSGLLSSRWKRLHPSWVSWTFVSPPKASQPLMPPSSPESLWPGPGAMSLWNSYNVTLILVSNCQAPLYSSPVSTVSYYLAWRALENVMVTQRPQSCIRTTCCSAHQTLQQWVLVNRFWYTFLHDPQCIWLLM